MTDTIIFNNHDMNIDINSDAKQMMRFGQQGANAVIFIKWKNVTGTLDGKVTLCLQKATTIGDGTPFKSEFQQAEYIINIDSADNSDNCQSIVVPFYAPSFYLKYEKNGITGGLLDAQISIMGA